MEGFQKPLRPSPKKFKDVRMAVVSRDGGSASCNCGWVDRARRPKVLDDKIERHLSKHHNGEGLWL